MVAISINTGTSFDIFQRMSLIQLFEFMNDYVEVVKKRGRK